MHVTHSAFSEIDGEKGLAFRIHHWGTTPDDAETELIHVSLAA